VYLKKKKKLCQIDFQGVIRPRANQLQPDSVDINVGFQFVRLRTLTEMRAKNDGNNDRLRRFLFPLIFYGIFSR
jgi:hypothetical protein